MENITASPFLFETMRKMNRDHLTPEIKPLLSKNLQFLKLQDDRVNIFIELCILALVFKLDFTLQNQENLIEHWNAVFSQAKFRFSKTPEIYSDDRKILVEFFKNSDKGKIITLVQKEYEQAPYRNDNFKSALKTPPVFIATNQSFPYLQSFFDLNISL